MNSEQRPHARTQGRPRPTAEPPAASKAAGEPRRNPEIPFSRSYWVRPGRLLAGCYPGDIDPDEATSKLGGLLRCGVTHAVNLMEEHEHDFYGRLFADYRPALEQLATHKHRRVTCLRCGIPDMTVPPPERMRVILDLLDATIQAGGVVYVHCLAGKGRTGTVMGCYLVRHGLSGEQALARLQDLTLHRADVFWPTPQTTFQREFVRNWREGE